MSSSAGSASVAGRSVRPVAARRLRSAFWPLAAVAVAVLWTGYVVSRQPVRSPWWTYADADATYAATALNLTYGNSHARYLDHPGLPLHILLASSFEVERLAHRLGGDALSESAFFSDRMLHLDKTRLLFRGWAIAFYLLGAALSVLLVARLLGHLGWGLTAGVMWVGAPGLAPMSIQYRPDVPLSVLVLVVGYAIVRAAETRSPLRYLAAGALLGFALTVKLHAAGLAVPLLLAALWRSPGGDWWRRLREEASTLDRLRRLLLGAAALLWLVLVVVFNKPRIPFTPTDEQVSVLINSAALLAIYTAAALAVSRWDALRWLRRVFRPFMAALGLAIAAGIAVPAAIVLDDGLQMLVVISRGLTGGGVNEEIEPFAAPLHQLTEFPLRQATIVFVIAGIAAALGVARREPLPVLLFAGAAVLAVMAQARLATTHYFAPAYVLSVPAALWLLRERAGRAAFVAAAALALLVVLPQYRHRGDAEYSTASFAAAERPALELVESRLRPDEVGLVPASWPNPDARYFQLVYLYVEHTPEYPYRFLPDLPQGLDFARDQGLRPRYFVGPVATTIAENGPLKLVSGTYQARRITEVNDAVALLSGP